MGRSVLTICCNIVQVSFIVGGLYFCGFIHVHSPVFSWKIVCISPFLGVVLFVFSILLTLSTDPIPLLNERAVRKRRGYRYQSQNVERNLAQWQKYMQASIFCLLSDLGPEAGQQSSRLMQTCLSHKKRKQNSYTLGIGGLWGETSVQHLSCS